MPRPVLFLFLLFFSQLSMALSYTLAITEKDIQDKVSAMMPIEKKQWVATITISDAKVRLIRQSSEIGVSASVKLQVPGGLEGTGQADIKGALSYSAAEGAFYLHKPFIEQLNIDQIPAKYHSQVQSLSQKAITKALSRYPVYKLKDNDVKQKMAKALLKSVAVKDQKLMVTLSAF